MSLFYNPKVSGEGVSKKAPKKKPFFRFWELFGANFWSFFLINLIYVLFCLPVVTVGPATSAAAALMRNIYLERPRFIWHDFLEEFKKNFKKSVFIGIVDVVVMAASVFALILFAAMENKTTADIITAVIAAAAGIVFLMMNFYIFPMIAALDLKLGDILRNAFILTFVNLGGELIALAFFVGYGILISQLSIIVLWFIPLVPLAWLGFLATFCCYPAIQKYIINPYYEKIGEPNPEIPEWEQEEEGVFEDMGGSEKPIDLKQAGKTAGGKKVIK